MKTISIIVPLLVVLFAGCTQEGTYTAAETDNPPFKKNTAFKGSEDLSLPKFAALREKYRIDTVFRGGEDEFQRQLLLRNWIRSVIRISDFEPTYPGDDYAERILDEALKGQGYHCGHYMIVQNAVMNAYGYVTRCLGAGPGVKGGPDGHHGINEIWSNTFRKWYLSDAKYNHHFEKNGVPLSALEIRDEYLKNKVRDVTLVKGPSRTPIHSDGVADVNGVMISKTPADFAQTYTWIEWESYNDRYTHWPESGSHVSILNMYEDDFFRNNTWIWDGKPHWAYAVKDHLVRVSERDAIEWTPNTIQSEVGIEKQTAHITLSSETPNLRSYQIKRSAGSEWEDISATITLDLTEATHEWLFRTVNLAGVTGPEHRIVVGKRSNH